MTQAAALSPEYVLPGFLNQQPAHRAANIETQRRLLDGCDLFHDAYHPLCSAG
jgi:hypothetical protein